MNSLKNWVTYLQAVQINPQSKSKNTLIVPPAHPAVWVHHLQALFLTSRTVIQSQKVPFPLRGLTPSTTEGPCVPNIIVFYVQSVVCLDPILKCSINHLVWKHYPLQAKPRPTVHPHLHWPCRPTAGRRQFSLLHSWRPISRPQRSAGCPYCIRPLRSQRKQYMSITVHILYCPSVQPVEIVFVVHSKIINNQKIVSYAPLLRVTHFPHS